MSSKVDLVILLRSGVQIMNRCFETAENLKNLNIESRTLYFFPYVKESFYGKEKITRNIYTATEKYNLFKSGFSINKEIICMPRFESFEEYKQNPLLRISNIPETENFVILMDNVYEDGCTMLSAVDDFEKMGYDRTKILGYAKNTFIGLYDTFLNNTIALPSKFIKPSMRRDLSFNELVNIIELKQMN